MARPVVSRTTERLYAGLPGFYRDQDTAQDYPLLRYLSLIGEVAGELERLLDRMDYLTPDERRDASRELVPPPEALVGQNVALGRAATASWGSPLTAVTDGLATVYDEAPVGLHSVTVDLGRLEWMDSVRVWHYSADARTYHGTKTEISDDGLTWSVVFDSAVHGGNLLPGGDFEQGDPGWGGSYYGSAPAIVSPGYLSNNACGFTVTSSVNPQGMTQFTPLGTAVPLGTKVRSSAWVKGPAGRQAILQARVSRPNGLSETENVPGGNGSAPFVFTGQWQLVQTGEWGPTAPLGGSSDTAFRPGVQLRLSGAGPFPLGEQVAWDDVRTTARSEYVETAAGQEFTFPARRARFIRDWLNGASVGGENRWQDVQAQLSPAEVTSELVDPAYADEGWLPWLAQLTGMRIGGMTVPERREALAGAVSGRLAGTRGGIVLAAQQALTGTREVTLVDHYDDDPFLLGVQTVADETPDPDAVIDAVLRAGAKPAGFVLVHTFYSAEWGTIEAQLPTWAALELAGSWRKVTATVP